MPEVAARAHIEHIDKVIHIALDKAGIGFDDLDGIAATCGPGLIGGVMIGMIAGKSIAASLKRPFLAINHLEAHALTARLTDKVEFPYLVLLVSGGHTQFLIAEDVDSYKRLGTTLDDAVGECFDKSAKLMGLPYPGGPNIEEFAKNVENPVAAEKRFPLPSPLKDQKNCDFSFSGLKTAVKTHVDRLPQGELEVRDIQDLSHALQQKIAEILAYKSEIALEQYLRLYSDLQNPTFVVCGGVAANKTICAALEAVATTKSTKMSYPPLNLAGDNGAMIAWAGVEKLQRGLTSPLDFKARPRWPLDPDAAPRHGAGVKA